MSIKEFTIKSPKNEEKILYKYSSKVTVVLGAQWGDEGKGKLTDMLAKHSDIVCRCQGGNNADHLVVSNGTVYDLHILPCGILNSNCISLIGNGTVINIDEFFDEINKNVDKGLKNWEKNLIISDRAHIVLNIMQDVDEIQEIAKGENCIGTTKKGIGPTYTSKAMRIGLRICDLVGDFEKFTEKFKNVVEYHQKLYPQLQVDVEEELKKYEEYAEKIRPLVRDSVTYIHEALKKGKKVVVEGANGALLDIDFGTYPYVTSSNSTIGGVCTGLGIPASLIGDIIGVVKSYTSRVGDGPFPTELFDDIGHMFQTFGNETGTTTNRKRRCGWLDLHLLKYSAIVNGYTAICLTKLDLLDTLPEIKIGVGYKLNGRTINYFPANSHDLGNVQVVYITLQGWEEKTGNIRNYFDLPKNAINFIETVEKYLNVPVKWIGVGRDRKAMIISP